MCVLSESLPLLGFLGVPERTEDSKDACGALLDPLAASDGAGTTAAGHIEVSERCVDGREGRVRLLVFGHLVTIVFRSRSEDQGSLSMFG